MSSPLPSLNDGSHVIAIREDRPASAAMNEQDLMKQIAAEDGAAFHRLVRLYFDRLFQFAARLLGDRIEAEDVIQECFLTVWQKADTWRPTASLSSWLHRIVHNRCIDIIRKRRPTLDSDEIEVTDPKPSPETLAINGQRADMVETAITKLPHRQQAALHLVHYGGLSGKDAAATLDISVEALESLLSRARRTLRNDIVPCNAEGSKHD